MLSKMTSSFEIRRYWLKGEDDEGHRKKEFYYIFEYFLHFGCSFKTVIAAIINFNNQSNEILKITKQRMGGAITLFELFTVD